MISNLSFRYGLLFSIFSLLFSCAPEPPAKGAVVSAREEASKIGVAIMKKGGNAFDAMIATDFALAVCYPNAGNIAGGGFAVYRHSNSEMGSLDYREKAPLAAYAEMYLDESGNVIPKKSTFGGLSVGVPGTVAGLEAIHQRFEAFHGKIWFSQQLIWLEMDIELLKNSNRVSRAIKKNSFK